MTATEQQAAKAFVAKRELERRETERRRFNWELTGRPEQQTPPGDWYVWLYMAGRGAGKTRTGAEFARQEIKTVKYFNLIGATADDVRDIMVEGESGILAVCPKDERPKYVPSKRRLEWPNGAKSLLFTADEPDRLRGKQHGSLWCDELAAWRYMDSYTQAMLGLRLGKSPRAYISTTPRPLKLLRDLVKDPKVYVTSSNTYANKANLSAAFFSSIITKYEGTRLGRQELDGQLLEDTPGALWSLSRIDELRTQIAPELSRILISIDPAVTSGEEADETGLLVVGLAADGSGWVLADLSGRYTPSEWASKAVDAWREWNADAIIGEANNGGDMIESTLRAVSANIPFRKVWASRGKVARAEPVSALYEKGRVHHVGTFTALEDEMFSMTTDGSVGDRSPNRCFVADTMIATSSGDKKIQDVAIGDLVWTRSGLRPVVACGLTDRDAQVSEVRTSTGQLLIGTKDHPVFVHGKGFTSINALVWGDILEVWQGYESALSSRVSSTTGTLMRNCGRIASTTAQCVMSRARRARAYFTGQSGSHFTGRSPMDATFTTLTITHSITTRPGQTTSASLKKSTAGGIQLRESGYDAHGYSLPKFNPWLLSGTGLRLGWSGTENTASLHGMDAPGWLLSAFSAVFNIRRHFQGERDSAHGHALIAISNSQSATTNPAHARNVASHSRPRSQKHKEHALVSVVGSRDAGRAPVFNLTVADTHEYYANGILVHNCDALVWGFTELMLGNGRIQFFPDFRAFPRAGEPVNACHVVQ